MIKALFEDVECVLENVIPEVEGEICKELDGKELDETCDVGEDVTIKVDDDEEEEEEEEDVDSVDEMDDKVEFALEEDALSLASDGLRGVGEGAGRDDDGDRVSDGVSDLTEGEK